VASDVTEYDRRGHVRRAGRPWFYAGAPLALPLQQAAPSAPVVETRYDAFGRAVEHYGLDGALTRRGLYHAMSIETLDALDVLPSADPTPTTAVKDGHGRDAIAVETLDVGAAKESHATQMAYSPAGDIESITRSSDTGAAPVVRWMKYDSLGRRVLNVEP